MLLLRHFSGITTPVIAGYHADIKRREQRQKFAAGFIRSGSERISQNTACFGVVCVLSSMLLTGYLRGIDWALQLPELHGIIVLDAGSRPKLR